MKVLIEKSTKQVLTANDSPRWVGGRVEEMPGKRFDFILQDAGGREQIMYSGPISDLELIDIQVGRPGQFNPDHYEVKDGEFEKKEAVIEAAIE
jgi:hypothetical protein